MGIARVLGHDVTSEPHAVRAGILIGDMARYVLATCLVLGMGLLMGYRPAGGACGAALAVALILVFAFSVSWMMAGTWAACQAPAGCCWRPLP